MALIVTFTSISGSVAVDGGWTQAAPVPLGRAARSEEIAITGGTAGSTLGELAAQAADNIVVLRATEDCWVICGDAEDLALEAGEGHYLPADTFRELGVVVGDKVAVVAA